jgi:hypothetical protein
VAALATSSLSTDKGVHLAPSKEDFRPWYSSQTGERSMEDDRKDKDGKRYVFTLGGWWSLYIVLPVSAMRLGKRATLSMPGCSTVYER